MITAVHTLIYADDPDATRDFLRDVLQLQFVDVHDGWLIFKTGPSEVGVHPTSGQTAEGEPWQGPMTHQLTFMVDDLEATITELAERGAEFSSEIADQGWGRTIMLKVPGAQDIMLYEARHPVAYNL